MSLDELAHEGARRMLAAALEAEVDGYLAAFAELVDERGHRLVRRNGHAQPASLQPESGRSRSSARGWTTAGWIPHSGQRQQFHSQILPRWCRSPKVA
jgi:putative transposase